MDTVVAGKPASQGMGGQALPGSLMMGVWGQEYLQNPGQVSDLSCGPEPQLHVAFPCLGALPSNPQNEEYEGVALVTAALCWECCSCKGVTLYGPLCLKGQLEQDRGQPQLWAVLPGWERTRHEP